jgi:hypothetical protein
VNPSSTGKSHSKHIRDGAGSPLLRWYPAAWRTRYGDELLTLLDDEYGGQVPARVRLSLVTGGLRQRARQSGLSGDSAPASQRVRAGALVILAAWTAFVIAGSSFAKFSEHFDQALPHGVASHHVPDLAFTMLQTVAAATGVLVLAGALLVVPTFVRFLRSGGWSSVRTHCFRTLACTAITGSFTVLVLVWAHHLTAHQRTGGLHWYGLMFLLWAALMAITLATWSGMAMAIVGKLTLPTRILSAEAVLAAVVALAMVVMVGATAVWWGAMTRHAPGFLSASPGGAPSAPWDLWFMATFALMALAMVTGAAGVIRVAREWPKMRIG